MAAAVGSMSCAVTLATLMFLVMFCPSVQSAYFYNRDANSNYHHHPRTAGYHSTGMLSQHRTVHHKHHQNNGSNSGRIQQAAVGTTSKGRHMPYIASTISTTPSSKLSPLDRLMNRLDLEERKLTQINHKSHVTHFDQGNVRGASPPPMLRSSDRRYAHARSHAEDSYEDDEGEYDSEDVVDGGNIRNEDEYEDEDEDERNEEEEERLSQGRHQYQNHNTGHNVARGYDGAVADFPDRPHASSTGSSGSVTGNGQRWGGFSSYSEWKWHVLNKPNMDMLRNHKGTYKPVSSDADLSKAVQHAVTMGREGQCRVPKPRLIQVKDVYPHPSKTYIPHCTILHQCGDDAGCCKSDTLTCTARKAEQVELYFYTTTLRTSGVSRARGGPTVEKLVFNNHTECICVDRLEEFMPRDRPSANNDKENTGRHGSRGYYSPDTDSGNGESNPCRCPSQFSARHADGTCVCECFDKQRDCIRAKRGKDFLPHDDRICILRGECMAPSCEFGTYLRRAGRCPKKQDKFEAWQHYPLHDEEYI